MYVMQSNSHTSKVNKMSELMEDLPLFRHTIERLEAVKRVNADGVEYWFSREINGLMGYPRWDAFEPVITRASEALTANKIDPSHHILETTKMMELGGGAKRLGREYFLSRAACYLISMNGDPTKPEIAAAQTYFATQTRKQELEENKTDEEQRLEVREKVKGSFKRVSGVAQNAGVRGTMQGVFHDARYQGLYGKTMKDLKNLKGLGEKEQLFDRAGFLELSAHNFQMNLAADSIKNSGIKSEVEAIRKNKEIAQKVRQTMVDAGATMPENLKLEPPIKEIQKKITANRKALSKPSSI
jgi:DNA-damage-inducible protein D